MIKRLFIGIIVLFCLGCAVNVNAEVIDVKNKFSIGGDIGYWFTSLKDPSDPKNTIGNFMFGGNISYGVSKETLLGISANYWSWGKVSNVLNTDIETRYTAVPVMLSIIYIIEGGSKEISPFIDLKLGINYFTIKTSSSVSSTELSDIKVAFGGSFGVEILLSKEFAVAPQIGYLYGGYTDLNGFIGTVTLRIYF